MEGVTAEQAHAIATAIFKDADVSEGGKVGTLDYAEFLDCVEGETIATKDFLENVGDSSEEPNFQRCIEVFKEQRARDEGEREQRGGKRSMYNQIFGSKQASNPAIMTDKI